MQTGIEAQAVQDPDQISQLGVVEVHLQGANTRLTTTQQQKMLPGTRRGNLDRLGWRSKGASKPTHQITGVGQHHVDQLHQVVKSTLQLGASSPIQGPVRDDPQSVRGMASGDIWKAFQF
jgi:hypothetical protein